MRLLVRRRFEEGARAQLHQAAVARLAGGQQHDPRQRPHPPGKPRVARLVAEIERQRAADDRLDAVAGELLGEFERPEHVVGVGQRQRRLVIGLGELGELADGQRAFEQRIGGMHVQMHEAGVGGHGRPQRFGFKRWWGRGPPCPPRSQAVPVFPRRANNARLKSPGASRRSRPFGCSGGTAVMAREPGKPCFRCHPRPIGDGGCGREYPRQTGMTSGWGPQRRERERNATTQHAQSRKPQLRDHSTRVPAPDMTLPRTAIARAMRPSNDGGIMPREEEHVGSMSRLKLRRRGVPPSEAMHGEIHVLHPRPMRRNRRRT